MSIIEPPTEGVTTPPNPPTFVQMPAEPCLVISDGECIVIATDRTCEPVRQWAMSVGPIARTITTARLRALADFIEGADA